MSKKRIWQNYSYTPKVFFKFYPETTKSILIINFFTKTLVWMFSVEILGRHSQNVPGASLSCLVVHLKISRWLRLKSWATIWEGRLLTFKSQEKVTVTLPNVFLYQGLMPVCCYEEEENLPGHGEKPKISQKTVPKLYCDAKINYRNYWKMSNSSWVCREHLWVFAAYSKSCKKMVYMVFNLEKLFCMRSTSYPLDWIMLEVTWLKRIAFRIKSSWQMRKGLNFGTNDESALRRKNDEAKEHGVDCEV